MVFGAICMIFWERFGSSPSFGRLGVWDSTESVASGPARWLVEDVDALNMPFTFDMEFERFYLA